MFGVIERNLPASFDPILAAMQMRMESQSLDDAIVEIKLFAEKLRGRKGVGHAPSRIDQAYSERCVPGKLLSLWKGRSQGTECVCWGRESVEPEGIRARVARGLRGRDLFPGRSEESHSDAGSVASGAKECVSKQTATKDVRRAEWEDIENVFVAGVDHVERSERSSTLP